MTTLESVFAMAERWIKTQIQTQNIIFSEINAREIKRASR
jgi:hypothetical protein